MRVLTLVVFACAVGGIAFAVHWRASREHGGTLRGSDECVCEVLRTQRVHMQAAADGQPLVGCSLRAYGPGLPPAGLIVGPSGDGGALDAPAREDLLLECATPGWTMVPALRSLGALRAGADLELAPLATIRLRMRFERDGGAAVGWHVALPVGRNQWSHGVVGSEGDVALPAGRAPLSLVLAWSSAGEVHLLPLVRPASEMLHRGTSAEFFLQRAERQTHLRIVDSSGSPVAGARFSFLSSGACPGLTPDLHGSVMVRYGSLIPCAIHAPGYTTQSVDLEGEPQREVRLVRSRSARVPILHPRGDTEGCLDVWFRALPAEPDTLFDHLRTAVQQGEAELAGLPESACQALCLYSTQLGPEAWLPTRLPARGPVLVPPAVGASRQVRLHLRGGRAGLALADEASSILVLVAPPTPEYRDPVQACREFQAILGGGPPLPERAWIQRCAAPEYLIRLPASAAEQVLVVHVGGAAFGHALVPSAVLPTDLDIELLPPPTDPCKAPIRVLLSNGRPPASATIRLRSIPTGEEDTVEFHGFVDSLGFALVPCREGEYEMSGFVPPDNTPLRGRIRLVAPFAQPALAEVELLR